MPGHQVGRIRVGLGTFEILLVIFLKALDGRATCVRTWCLHQVGRIGVVLGVTLTV